MRLAAIKPPQLRTIHEEGERSATWLELFYDLVFVAAVAILGVRLAKDSSFTGWLSYAAFFALIWWLWASHTFYADRFDTDDLVYRLLAGVQMITIAMLAASLSTDVSGSTTVFAAAYALSRLVLIVMYVRVYRHVDEARHLVRGYLTGFSMAAGLWLVSVVMPEPWRFVLWGIALAIDLATPYVMRKAQASVPLDVSHLPERFGLFTILVLGETIVAVTVGLSHVSWQWTTTLVGAFGIMVATGLWWIHFDNLDGFVVRRRGAAKAWRPTAWIYTHLPLAVGLAMVGIGIEHAIVAADGDHVYHTDERLVFIFGVIMVLGSMALIQFASVGQKAEHVKRRIVGNRVIGIAAVALIGALAFLGPVATVSLVVVVIAVEVGGDILALSVPEDKAP